jgi:hypothetical protein
LLPRDKDEQLDLYDARAPHVPGEPVGFSEAEVFPCSGEACKGSAISPPAQESASSSEFHGPGNRSRQHKKHKTHKKHHKAHKKHHKAHGGPSSPHRRGRLK